MSAPEAVDRLRVVADDRQIAVLGGEQLEPAVLDLVGVLVLVDHDPAERLRSVGTSWKRSSSWTERTSRSSKSIAFMRWSSRS